MPTQSLPSDLAGPVALGLARGEEDVPRPSSMPGGCLYELKWDGFRVAVVRERRSARVWSRRGTDLSDCFPDLVDAAMIQLQAGTVVDAEAVVWKDGRLDFDELQLRLVSGTSAVRSAARRWPASLVVFDVLGHGWRDLRALPLRRRRTVLERLAGTWSPPLQLSPATRDEGEARRWLAGYAEAGIEGLVVKGLDARYPTGRRMWVKVRNRDTVEVVVGAVTGRLDRPETVVAGRYRDGELVVVGRTVPLSPDQAAGLAQVLRPAAAAEHPWPEVISGTRFSTGAAKVPLVRVVPDVVAEVLADTARHAGGWRHPLRFVRVRRDVTAADVEPAWN